MEGLYSNRVAYTGGLVRGDAPVHADTHPNLVGGTASKCELAFLAMVQLRLHLLFRSLQRH
jgi:hypothetical protein